MKHAIASLRFSLEEGRPYYLQLVDQIQESIAAGKLALGDKLPSSRALSASLGVSRSTTTKAYDQLLCEGILVSEEKRGVFVAAQLNMNVPGNALSSSQHSQKDSPSRSNEWFFDSGSDVSVFPTKEWAASMRRSWLKPDLTLLQGGYLTGLPDLKVAVADYLFRVRGLQCLPEQVVITAGNRDALMLLQHTLNHLCASPDWWIENPTYTPIRQLFHSQKNKPGYIPIDDEGAGFVPDKAKSNVAILTPNRQYPLGIKMNSARRHQWLQKLQHSDWWLIEDDYDNEFVYQGRSDVPLFQSASLYKEAADKVFFVGSFSKVLFRGLRLGFMVVPLKHLDLIQNSQKRLGSSSSLAIQPAIADYMMNGSFDRHLNRMRRHYRLKRDFLLALLEKYLSDYCTWEKPNNGMHMIVYFKSLSDAQAKTLDQKMMEQGGKWSWLHEHYAKSASVPKALVLGFTAISKERMEKGVMLIVQCLRAKP